MNSKKLLAISALALLGACGSSDNKPKAAKQPAISNAVVATAATTSSDGTVYSAAALRGTDTATGQPVAARAYDVRRPDGSETLRAYAIEPAM